MLTEFYFLMGDSLIGRTSVFGTDGPGSSPGPPAFYLSKGSFDIIANIIVV